MTGFAVHQQRLRELNGFPFWLPTSVDIVRLHYHTRNLVAMVGSLGLEPQPAKMTSIN